LLKRCRQLWPQHQLALVCRKGLGDFFLQTKLVDHVYEIKKGDKESYRKILQDLKNVERIISPHQSLRTGFFCKQIQAKEKISYSSWWNFLIFSKRISRNKNLPDPLRQLSLLCEDDESLRSLIENYLKRETPYKTQGHGKLSEPPAWASMSLRSSVMANETIFKNLRDRFSLEGFSASKTVLLFPGSVWATKRWTKEGFVKTGQALQQQGYQIYLMGGPGEEELAEQVAQQIPQAVSLAGKTSIFESTQLIARSSLVIANDSASAHLASVCETPLLTIFGPTVLEFGYRPWSAQSYVVQKAELPCRPCGKHGHKVCPIKTHVCMKAISAAEVLESAGFILRQSNPSR